MYGGNHEWSIPTKVQQSNPPTSGDFSLYLDPNHYQQYPRQEDFLPSSTVHLISTGVYDTQKEQPKPHTKKSKKGENPQLHFSFVTHRMDLYIDVNRLLHDIRSCCPTAFDLILKKQQVDEIHSSQSGYGFVAFPTLSDCVTARDRLKGLTIELLTYDCEVAHRSTRKHSGGRQGTSLIPQPMPMQYNASPYMEQERAYPASASPTAPIHQYQYSSPSIPYGEYGKVGWMPGSDRYPGSDRPSHGYDLPASGDVYQYDTAAGDTRLTRHAHGVHGVDRTAVRYDIDGDMPMHPAQYNPSTYYDQRMSADAYNPTSHMYPTGRSEPQYYYPSIAGVRPEANFPARPDKHYPTRPDLPYYARQQDAAYYAPPPPSVVQEDLLFSLARSDRFLSAHDLGNDSTLLDRHPVQASSMVSPARGPTGNQEVDTQLPPSRLAEYRHFSESASLWDREATKLLSDDDLQIATNSMTKLLLHSGTEQAGRIAKDQHDNDSFNSFPPVGLDFYELLRADKET